MKTSKLTGHCDPDYPSAASPASNQFAARTWLVSMSVALLLTGFLDWPASAQQMGGGRGRSTAATRQYPSSGAIGDAYFSIDPETRRVITIADEDTSKYIAEVLQNLDKPKPQVLIKVVFLEVTHVNNSDIGIEGGYGRNVGNNTSAAGANAFGLSSIASALGTNALVNQFNQPISSFQPMPPGAGVYQILSQDYQVTLRAIAQSGKARILSRPSILARNNQPAKITVGKDVPLISSVRYDNYGNVINSITYESVGVILSVTPFITQDGMVEMIIQPEISSIDQTTSTPISKDASVPAINVRSADTVAVTPDGQTVIIGGLMETTKAQNDTKIPVLGDLPLLGNLFKRRTKTGSNTELLIFLTPHIVAAPSELAALSEKEKAKALQPGSFDEKELNKFLDTVPNAPATAPEPTEKGKKEEN